MSNRIPADQIKPELEKIVKEAETQEPELAKRLTWFLRWIKDEKTGLLTKKRLVMDLQSFK